VGQKVFLNVNNFTLAEDLTPKFMSKKMKLRFPLWIECSRICINWNARDQSAFDIHVSSLSPFKVDNLWPDHKHVIRPSPDLVGGHLEYEVRGHPQV